MTSEITPALDPKTRHPMGSRVTEDVRAFDSLGLRAVGNRVKVDLIGNNHQMKHFIRPQKGHKNVTQFNPTLDSIKPLLKEIKEPSTLLLKGCDQLFLQSIHFPFETFEALTSLEISNVSNLITLPEKPISEMTQLQSLNLSHLPIIQLPPNDFLSNLTNLRSLVLTGCSSLHSLPRFPQLTALEYLDLSHLLIESLPDRIFSDLEKLHCLILRGCVNLKSLPSTKPLRNLEVLDLSYCTSLQELESIQLNHPRLQMLDLSYTALDSSPTINSGFRLTHLFLRDAKVVDLDHWSRTAVEALRVLDLSGAQNVENLDELVYNCHLVALDASRTRIVTIYRVSTLFRLRYLILRDCTELFRLPEMERLKELEVLDISGCVTLGYLPGDFSKLGNLKELNLSGCSGLEPFRPDVFDQMSCLEKLDVSKTNFHYLPSLANVTNLRTLNISHTFVKEVPELSDLINLKTFLFENCPNLKGVPEGLRALANPDLANQHPASRLGGGISKPNEFHLVSTFFSTSGFDRFKQGFDELVDLISNISSQSFRSHSRRMIADLKYILDNIDLLESSDNCTSADELLKDLLNASNRLSSDDLPPDSIKLDDLLRKVAKLKLLVPAPKQGDTLKKNNMVKKKKNLTMRSNDKEEVVAEIDMNMSEMQDLSRAYDSLTSIQRNCLLYFVVFPCSSMFLSINERILIQLWYGEGFIDDQQNLNTIEEIGREVLMVLEEKQFIVKLMKYAEGSHFWYMATYVHRFVREKAKAKPWFDFDQKNGKLMPHVTGSHWACLLKSRCIDSSERLQSYKAISTLFNVRGTVIDFRAEWFSKMRNLSVLHLGRWDYKHDDESIEVVDLKFLEELKNMKQLRLLNLEGFSTITKLPDSFCKVTSLKILGLRECSYLEELPSGIGSLKNLTHLDLTDCHILSMLPKGLSFISNLEVLKGFVITYQIGGQQHRNACSLADLLKLEKLRKLNLVVNNDSFPDSKDLEVFKEMRNLGNLKITWERNYNYDRKPQDVIEQKALKYSRWKRFKCWESEKEEPSKYNHLDNLKKLVLFCFPSETSPNWLRPSALDKLEKLYILGGNLKTLSGDADQNTWNVKTLRLGYLRNLEMDWEVLRCNFPYMTYLKAYGCDLSRFPCNGWGVWQLKERANV